LLTLTGPPGVGKTRLALAAAAALAPAFPDGLWFAPLAAVADPALVASAVARAVGVPDAGDRALPARLADALGARRALLVLDDFEQVVAAAPLVAALRTACPGLSLLVTSRRPLRLSGERELRLRPLAVPPPLGPGGVATSAAMDDPATGAPTEPWAPAVDLFVQRARDARPDFVHAGPDAVAVAAVCRRLDGLPLALELAAARLRHLTAPALLALLTPALPLLTAGPRDAPARHQTLRQTIAWSEALLGPAERALFRRLGVFAGGCTPEATAAVVGGWPAPGPPGAPVAAGRAGRARRGAGGAPGGVARQAPREPATPPERRLAALERLGALVDQGLLQ
jgi:predicted ATPase